MTKITTFRNSTYVERFVSTVDKLLDFFVYVMTTEMRAASRVSKRHSQPFTKRIAVWMDQ